MLKRSFAPRPRLRHADSRYRPSDMSQSRGPNFAIARSTLRVVVRHPSHQAAMLWTSLYQPFSAALSRMLRLPFHPWVAYGCGLSGAIASPSGLVLVVQRLIVDLSSS